MSSFAAGSLAVDGVVLTAMDEEAEPFFARATTVSDPERFGHAVHRSVEIDGLRLLVVRSGIGLVNAAAATTEAVLRSRPGDPAPGSPLSGPPVISAGSAGGVGADVAVGEVIVGASYANADADARVFGYEIGQTPQMPPRYAGDPALVAVATRLDLRDGDGVDLPVRSGLILSSDAFISGGQAVAEIRDAFPDALATDMESLASAQVCSVHGVPFASIRGISDLADPSATEVHLTHVDDASDRSTRVVLAVLAAFAGRAG
jgi:adenosylhomocysteine nucleosidase